MNETARADPDNAAGVPVVGPAAVPGLVQDKGEPVCVGYTFYRTAHEAAEALWDDGKDPTEAIAHPCTVGKASTPDLREYIEEAWGEQFEDPDIVDIPDRLATVCREFQAVVESMAPASWIPRTGERVALPAIDESTVVTLTRPLCIDGELSLGDTETRTGTLA